MPKIRCYYEDCIFLDEGYCTAAAVEIDPNQGCLTYKPVGEFLDEEGEWLEEEEAFLDESLEDELWDEDEEGEI